MLRHKALKLRIEPNEVQTQKITQFCGAARWVFNTYLHERHEVYKDTNETLSWQTFKKALVSWKQESYLAWLKQVDKFVIEQACQHVEDAYQRFFKGLAKFPKYKKKNASKQTYTTCFTNNNIELILTDKLLKLPKLGKVPFRMSKNQYRFLLENGLSGSIKKATVTKHSSGAFYVSILLEEQIETKPAVDIASISDDDIIGIDLGLTHFAITSKGDKIDNPKYFAKRLHLLAKLQRQLKKKKLGSSNYQKLQQKIAKLHLKISHMRHNFLHQISRKLVNENQVIVLEDLNVKGMIKNKKLSKSISDVGWGLFKTFLTYKCEWENKKLVLVDTFFPSSKLCNSCKEKNIFLTLSDRIWVCPSCAYEHDRDINATLNIKQEGLRLLCSLKTEVVLS